MNRPDSDQLDHEQRELESGEAYTLGWNDGRYHKSPCRRYTVLVGALKGRHGVAIGASTLAAVLSMIDARERSAADDEA